MENPLFLLTLLGKPLGRWLVGGVAAFVAAAAIWLYVGGLQADRDHLRVQVHDLAAQNQQLGRTTIALADELAAAKDRADTYQSIKEEVYASPQGDVPADIRAALERLRNPQRP